MFFRGIVWGPVYLYLYLFLRRRNAGMSQASLSFSLLAGVASDCFFSIIGLLAALGLLPEREEDETISSADSSPRSPRAWRTGSRAGVEALLPIHGGSAAKNALAVVIEASVAKEGGSLCA